MAANSSGPTRKCAAIRRSTTSTSALSRTSGCSRFEICAETKKHVQVQKPIATNLETAREDDRDGAARPGSCLGVVSQHRFDDSSQFLKKAIADGRLGKILQADAYVKWFRSAGVLQPSDQRQLGDRRRRRADQSGGPSSGCSAMACRVR